MEGLVFSLKEKRGLAKQDESSIFRRWARLFPYTYWLWRSVRHRLRQSRLGRGVSLRARPIDPGDDPSLFDPVKREDCFLPTTIFTTEVADQAGDEMKIKVHFSGHRVPTVRTESFNFLTINPLHQGAPFDQQKSLFTFGDALWFRRSLLPRAKGQRLPLP